VTLPEWMSVAGENGPARPARSRHAVGSRWVRRAANGLAQLMAETLDQRTTCSLPGYLQGLDPRAKVVGLLGLVVATTLVHTGLALALAYAFAVVLALASGISVRRVGQVWLIVPLFTLAIMLPATLNIVTPGKNVGVIWQGVQGSLGPWRLPETLAITDTGIQAAVRMTGRTATCVTLTLLLAYTTRADRLFRGLRSLGMPAIFASVLTMMDRYLHVVAQAAHEIHLSKLSRTIRSGGIRQDHQWVAAGMGSLFRRTEALGGDVHRAMVSRGYRGDVHPMTDLTIRTQDGLFLVGCVGLAVMMLGLG